MVKYPIYVERKSYRGSDLTKRRKVAEYNHDAQMLEQHINNQIKSGRTGVFLYSNISREVELPLDRVRQILFSVACGDNGFTVCSNIKNRGKDE